MVALHEPILIHLNSHKVPSSTLLINNPSIKKYLILIALLLTICMDNSIAPWQVEHEPNPLCFLQHFMRLQ